MGTEGGQDLPTILRRKECERVANGGTFIWGIGNSVGRAIANACGASGMNSVDVLFSPMKSHPRSVDVEPEQLVLWTKFESQDGGRGELPFYSLVTSRASQTRRSHFALVCTSNKAVSMGHRLAMLDAALTRNFESQRPVGSSQVTSVVSYRSGSAEQLRKPYEVAFRAQVSKFGGVRLSGSVLLSPELMKLYETACNAESAGEWEVAVANLKLAASRSYADESRSQVSLFA